MISEANSTLPKDEKVTMEQNKYVFAWYPPVKLLNKTNVIKNATVWSILPNIKPISNTTVVENKEESKR